MYYPQRLRHEALKKSRYSAERNFERCAVSNKRSSRHFRRRGPNRVLNDAEATCRCDCEQPISSIFAVPRQDDANDPWAIDFRRRAKKRVYRRSREANLRPLIQS
jgi:hypothetical protein